MRQQLGLRGRWMALSASVLLAAGCGSDGKAPPKVDTVPVTGTVTLDGQPLPQATVTFHPETDNQFHGSQAVTDAQGKYKLVTDIGNGKTKDGAIAGKYKVTVSRLIDDKGQVVKFDPNVPPMNIGARESIDLKYSSQQLTELEADVKAGGPPIDFALPKEAVGT